MEFMLDTICEIKNNKKRPKEDTVQHTRLKKWLQKVGSRPYHSVQMYEIIYFDSAESERLDGFFNKCLVANTSYI